ncbi:regulator of volume decrease after cellular swelling-domain-containing protein [Trametes punicea]|nr:regulator of volume decrease after cellular swelling-domain-containing protein [Trametes punicea]
MAVVLIDTLPNFILPEEHKNLVASTPASFSDIPPVLRHKEDNVSVALDPPLESFSAEDAANGSLYVIESHLVFMSASGRGFQVEYPSITLHAISRGEKGPSIYCQLDDAAATQIDEQPQNDDEDIPPMRELSIIPKDSTALEPLFEALSFCASLHPDPDAENDMDDDDDAFVDPGEFETFNGDNDQELSEVGRVRSDFLNNSRFAPY